MYSRWYANTLQKKGKIMEKFEDLFNPSFLKETKSRAAIPADATVTMAYVPLQESLKTYGDNEGLEKGTIFPVLNKEFCGRMVKSV